MFRKFSIYALIICSGLIASCGSSESESADTAAVTEVLTEVKEVTDAAADDGFMLKTKEAFLDYIYQGAEDVKTYENADGQYLFFRKDGTMAGGRPGGEETMWEATWKYNGNVMNVAITMAPGSGTPAVSGDVKVEMFPDEGILILNGKDYKVAKF